MINNVYNEYLERIIELEELLKTDISKKEDYENALREEIYFIEVLNNKNRVDINNDLISKTKNEELKTILGKINFNLVNELIYYAGFVIYKKDLERFKELVIDEKIFTKEELEELNSEIIKNQIIRINKYKLNKNRDVLEMVPKNELLSKNPEIIRIINDIKQSKGIKKEKLRSMRDLIGDDNYKELLDELSYQGLLNEDEYLEELLDYNSKRHNCK